MVERELIEKSFRIAVLKCSPKQRALDYFNEHEDNFIEDVDDELWDKQNELQQKVTYTDDEITNCHYYNSGGYTPINGKLYNNEKWQQTVKVQGSQFVDMIDDGVKHIDSAIEKSPTLAQDTIFYKDGYVDDYKVGEHGKWKGYSSASYSEDFVDLWNKLQGRYKIKIYAPKGTRGIVQNNGFDACTDEREFTIDRNQKYVVLERDDDNKTATVLLY